MHDKLLREALHDYPSEDSSKSPMENAVELTALPDIGPVSHAVLDSWTFVLIRYPRIFSRILGQGGSAPATIGDFRRS